MEINLQWIHTCLTKVIHHIEQFAAVLQLWAETTWNPLHGVAFKDAPTSNNWLFAAKKDSIENLVSKDAQAKMNAKKRKRKNALH